MNGSIYVIGNNNQLEKMEQQEFESESVLQSLIEKHPYILPGEQINPEVPRKWLLVYKEMGIPAIQDGGSQWSLDLLLLDQDSIPTFVEVKRSSDYRNRRLVVAQMLDYAANAVEYWPLEFIKESYTTNKSITNCLENIGIPFEGQDYYWNTVESNLKSGRIRLIFVADSIPQSLLRIIEFLDNQMPIVEVIGAEVKQFKSSSGNFTALVSRLTGGEFQSSKTIASHGRIWTEEKFINRAAETNPPESLDVFRRLIRGFSENGFAIRWGAGKVFPSCNICYTSEYKRDLFSVYTQKNISVQINFKDIGSAKHKKKLKNLIESVGVVSLRGDFDKYPSFPIENLYGEGVVESFITAYIDWIEYTLENCAYDSSET